MPEPASGPSPLPDPDLAVPAGFEPLVAGGPYFRALGPVFRRPLDGGGVVVALRLAESHLNVQGFAHGGMLTSWPTGRWASTSRWPVAGAGGRSRCR